MLFTYIPLLWLGKTGKLCQTKVEIQRAPLNKDFTFHITHNQKTRDCFQTNVHKQHTLRVHFRWPPHVRPYTLHAHFAIVSNVAYVIRDPLHEHTHKKSTSNHGIYPNVHGKSSPKFTKESRALIACSYKKPGAFLHATINICLLLFGHFTCLSNWDTAMLSQCFCL